MSSAQAPNTSNTSNPPSTLTANYVSPDSSRTFQHDLPTLPAFSHPSGTTNDQNPKTAYLSALRTCTTKLQEEVNVFLTRRMEEDNKASAGTATAANGSKLDEKQEDENYGEEMVDED
ncbi:MAG: hypothetical protein M1819_002130 [Sarea resinae]|nr:MAG: hypothetical protein M1819_002130 [Sarea resinae]